MNQELTELLALAAQRATLTWLIVVLLAAVLVLTSMLLVRHVRRLRPYPTRENHHRQRHEE